MKKFYKKLEYNSQAAAKILLQTEIGDWVYFKDCSIRVDDGNLEHPCKVCAFYESQRNSAKCSHFEYCAAHKRPDHQSVVFKDSKIIDERHLSYVRSKGYNY